MIFHCKRQALLKLAGVITCLAALQACNQTGSTTRPNVIVILTDDQGYGDLSVHGNPLLTTPNLDKLASESIRLTDFHVAPVCTPTRSQLLTGRDACRNGGFAWAYSREIPHPEFPNMPEIFAANGYRTGHFGKWHLGDIYPYRPQDRGFQETITHGGASITQTPDHWNNDYFDDYFRHNGELQQYEGYCTDVWFREAMRFMRESQQEKQPFFVYLPTNAPHGPLYVADEYRRPWIEKLDAYAGDRVPEFSHRRNNRAIASFYGMITNIDENLARLEEMLQETGLRDNTIVIWMTDNGGTAGTPIYNAGMRGQKGSFYDGGHRVPCFIRWPGGGFRSAGDLGPVTEIQDILPTLVDLCGLKAPAGAEFDGRSLAPLLRGENQDLTDRTLVVQHATAPITEKWQSAVLWNQWRLVRGEELYDIRNDPAQQSDIAARHPDVVLAMRDRYEAWWKSAQPSLNKLPRFPLGDPKSNPVELTCFDWHGYEGQGNVTVQPTIRDGAPVNGYWNVEIVQEGEYEIALRRWPEAADLAITAPSPEYKAVDATFPQGKALPIVRAKVRAGDIESEMPVGQDDKAATFKLHLKTGQVQLQTWFYDAAGQALCGAYYTTVRKLDQ